MFAFAGSFFLDAEQSLSLVEAHLAHSNLSLAQQWIRLPQALLKWGACPTELSAAPSLNSNIGGKTRSLPS